jgi:hypothetical protein
VLLLANKGTAAAAQLREGHERQRFASNHEHRADEEEDRQRSSGPHLEP